ncbi:MAG: SDR family oxidoreductase [Peptostreptococcaceae bacterium]|nr:SDR family oxidoreductase [Peptostreptococcaceae bacterium]MDY5739374.1 SDR family oxidoreductase [Anaerovoracaceae bacterium]
MKTIFITGGSSGIGRAVVYKFAEEGWKVAFTYNSNKKAAEEIAAETGAVSVFWNGAAEGNPMKTAYENAKTHLGISGFDALLAGAGINLFSLYGTEDEEKLRELWQVNYFGVREAVKAVLPHMISEKKGSIILVSSMWGEVGGSCEVEYSATKGALIAMAKALAKEVGPSGVRVNCLSPGLIDTPMNSSLTEDDIKEICEGIALGRVGLAEEVASTAFYLASDASSYITGQILGVNGGII